MSEDFFRPVKFTEARKLRHASDDSKRPGIRLYCTQSRASWLIQVRGPLLRADGSAGDFIIAGSSLSLDDLRELRDACSRQLAELDE